MATLTASENPVGLWDTSKPGATTISWNTEGGFNGKVFLSVNGAAPAQFAGGTAGTRTGSQSLAVKFGEVYVLTLLRANNNALLAVLTVTTEDLKQALVVETVGAMALGERIQPVQAIFDVNVVPTVDTVQVRFRTRLPTIPRVAIERPDATPLAMALGLLNGLQTQHTVRFGDSDPLPQGADLRVRIIVPGRKPLIGSAVDVVRVVAFRTGTRLVDVLFDTIEVRTDGDPGIQNSGEFRLYFRAGDATSHEDFHAPSYRGDISAGDPPVVLDRNIPLVAGPRAVYVRVDAVERDLAIPDPFAGLQAVGSAGSRQTGSVWRETDISDETWVADVFDVSANGPGVTTLPMVLDTANFGVAYKVNGRITTIVRPGIGVSSPSLQFVPGKMGLAIEGGAKALLPGGQSGKGKLVARGEDGGVWTKMIDAERPSGRHGGWKLAAPSPGGALTAASFDDDTLDLVALGAEGDALQWQAGEGRRMGAWRSLGGSFGGALVIAPGARGERQLYGVDREGRVLTRTLDARSSRSAWEEIGEGVAGELFALAVPGVGTALFAVDRDGNAIHALRRNGDRSGAARWRKLGGPKVGWLDARLIRGGGVAVSALTEERQLFQLVWRDYPSERVGRAWQDLGAFEALQPTRAPERREAEAAANADGRALPASKPTRVAPRRRALEATA